MKIAVDKNITFGYEAFSTIGEVELVDGRNLTNDVLKGTDALIVRSVTNVNKELLENTPVKFVATATIGTDHLDKKYLQNAGIKYQSAPGCNSTAVTEYVLSALSSLSYKYNFDLSKKSIGIVGVGNIGKKVALACNALSMEVILNDPPRSEKEGPDGFHDLQTTLGADIITLHTPLIETGKYKTKHLLNHEILNSLRSGQILINASRGGVVDNTALTIVRKYKDIKLVLDVWENEPDISLQLRDLVEIATPHIAGYSFEGKVNGTIASYSGLCDFSGIIPVWTPDYPPIEENQISTNGVSEQESLHKIFNTIYNIMRDDTEMRRTSSNFPEYFDQMRKIYPVRRESKHYEICTDHDNVKQLFDFLKSI